MSTRVRHWFVLLARWIQTILFYTTSLRSSSSSSISRIRHCLVATPTQVTLKWSFHLFFGLPLSTLPHGEYVYNNFTNHVSTFVPHDRVSSSDNLTFFAMVMFYDLINQKCITNFNRKSWRGHFAKPRLRWEYDIKMKIKQGVDWINLAQNMVYWRALVNIVTSPWII